MGPRTVSIGYVVFAVLLLYAHTADFIATSFFANGHDSNHPVLRIEHKCVTRSAGIEDHEQPLPVVVPLVALVAATPLFLIALPNASSFASNEVGSPQSPHDLAPLRC